MRIQRIRRGAHWRECIIEDANGCLIWQGWTDRGGYGRRSGQHPGGTLAHRIVYWEEVGPIPEGLTLDHLCRNRACVNPAHLEPVTIGENLRRGNSLQGANARKTHCPQGHPYDEANTYIINNRYGPARACKTCVRDRARRRREAVA